MPRSTVTLLVGAILLSAPSFQTGVGGQEIQERPWGAFTFRDSVSVPLSPRAAFDRFVDVDQWWDHRFSSESVAFSLDPKPGGGFLEIFDESGDGVLHATVIFVQRGKVLRLRGPLGLSGFALDMVFTLEFLEEEGGTRAQLEARRAGELEEGWAEAVQGVWHHFLWERFKPYAEGTLK